MSREARGTTNDESKLDMYNHLSQKCQAQSERIAELEAEVERLRENDPCMVCGHREDEHFTGSVACQQFEALKGADNAN